MTVSSNDWAVIRCLGNHEFKVADHLRARAGLTIFVPKFKNTIFVRGRPQTRVQPLFPSYLLFLYDSSITMHTMRFVDGVLEIIRNAGRTSILPVNFVDDLKARCLDDGTFEPAAKVPPPREALVKGQKLRVVRGALCGLDVIVETTSAEDRIRVLWQALGNDNVVTLNRDDVEKTDAKAARRPSIDALR